MASNQTSNFQLSQWEANDEVLRADFNGDNLKIETALTAVKAVTDVAFTPENSPIAAGSYTGDGMASRKIDIGFTPKAVLVMPHGSELISNLTSGTYIRGGLAVTGSGLSTSTDSGVTSWVSGYTVIMVEEGGFRVGEGSEKFTKPAANSANRLFHYVAFR